MNKYIGFDIGGTKCSVCIGEVNVNSLNIIDKRSYETKKYEPLDMIDILFDSVEQITGLKDKEVGKKYPYMGVSCGGPLDEEKGIILSPPNLPGWDKIKIIELIEKRFSCKANIINDANACALAEFKFGAGIGSKNMAFLTFGTGMGCGLILNGHLYSGSSNMAGEIGHIRLDKEGPIGYNKNGSFEGFCSGGGIKQLGIKLAKEKLSNGYECSFCHDLDSLDSISAKSIAISAKEGNKDAIDVYKESGRRLGQALSILIDIINPDTIVIGSIYERSGNLLKEEMYKVLKEECLSNNLDVCQIKPAKLNENVGDYAAICVAMQLEEK